MIWEDLDKNLIHLQADAQHANDIFDQLGGCFVKEGYSRSDYVEALKQREAQFQPDWISMDSVSQYRIRMPAMYCMKLKES